jgi:phosphomannomutase
LALELLKNNFDFACGFDCDADRMEIILSPNSAFALKMGTPNVSGNYVLALACDAILQGTSGEIVPTNDVTSYLVRDVIKKHNASVFEVEVGEINVVEAMEKNNSIIGGEGSCAGVVVAPIKCRDGIMIVVLALKLMAEQGKTLSEILIDYPAYFSDRTKLACSPEQAVAIRQKIENYFKEKGWDIKKTGDETGGLKAHLDENSYVWFRQSKTEPGIFRIYSECDQSKEKATQLLEEGIKAFNKFLN